MSDLRALNDAFGELERRADVVTAGLPPDVPARSKSRLVPLAVAAAVIAGLATATALLVPDGPATQQGVAAQGTTTTVAPTTTTTAKTPPGTPGELAERFKAILGGTATFTVTESGPGAYRNTVPPPPPNVPRQTDVPLGKGEPLGAALVGQLTAGGVTGGYDLVVYPGADPTQPAQCDVGSPDCATRTLPDGSTLATDRTQLEGGGVTHLAHLIRADGLSITIHVSNRQNPKGMGGLTADQPPLTVEQLVEIVTSDRW
ncbi:hypothetical protein [Saccharothrix variisporea]|uniref:Uncharacterized protein n=1 Tax=Saccharothrix variisporea TaxID=543527 RepID=A0A495XE85_9PSEU|nr:hypothetical protein [Saccharothrix variisporea]RKT71435.1 hypothetical protein DFJ66_4724 [Saccharothrix variisporea]